MADKKGLKSKKLVQSAKHLAKEIAFQNSVHANLDYCLEHHTLCRITLHQDSWTAARVWWIVSLSRDYAYALRMVDFTPDGYEIVPVASIAEVVPMVHATEQCAMLNIAFPSDYPDLNLDSLPQLLSDLSLQEGLITLAHETSREENSHSVTGRIEKVGKKKVTIRGVDPADLTWHIKPDKMSYEEINRILFGTRQIAAYEHLAMSYDAFIRTANETVQAPEGLDDFEGGNDVRETASEDLVDIDELVAMEDLDDVNPKPFHSEQDTE